MWTFGVCEFVRWFYYFHFRLVFYLNETKLERVYLVCGGSISNWVRVCCSCHNGLSFTSSTIILVYLFMLKWSSMLLACLHKCALQWEQVFLQPFCCHCGQSVVPTASNCSLLWSARVPTSCLFFFFSKVYASFSSPAPVFRKFYSFFCILVFPNVLTIAGTKKKKVLGASSPPLTPLVR